MATTVSQDPDCYRWNNAPNLLCYECDSCKVGVLENIKRDWHKLSVLNMLSSLEYIPLNAVLSKTQKELKPVTPMARTGCLQSDPDGITTGELIEYLYYLHLT
ncbi:hypothetical protein RchiOBHm_Chr1g0363761 [Rosa chinensis]|uniref:Uncharacterized protein n=1 Tax=Rosa chinensis TaxID=74649 RepID=A0A2P6SJK7_ROSCH|nr:hypothetical protein RchiOBHm_Chr1g0363761 [Rosa chinensis]